MKESLEIANTKITVTVTVIQHTTSAWMSGTLEQRAAAVPIPNHD